MYIFILLNLMVALSSYLLLKSFFKTEDFLDLILAFAILAVSQIVLSLTLLGFFGILYIKNIILIICAIFLLSILLARYQRIVFGRKLFSTEVRSFNNFKFGKLELFCLSVIFGFAVVKLIVNLINPPFGWDDLNYHFTFPVEWLKHANLANPIVVSDDPAPSYYPINGSLVFFWLMFPIKSFFLADLGQLPFFIMACLAVYNLARKINLSKELAFFSAVLFALIPNFFKQLQIAYVDIIVAALFLVSLNFCLALKNNFNWNNLLLCAASTGLLIGTKSLSIIYALLLFIPILFLCYKNLKKLGLLKLLCQICVFGFVLIVFGGFSYIRNMLLTNNPFYPMDVVIFSKLVFKGAINSLNYAAHFVAGDYALSKLLFHEGLGLQTLLFVLPGSLLALLLYLFKNKQREWLMSYFFILPLLLYLVFRFIIPLANVRYVYNLLGIGIICGFFVSQKLKIPLKALRIIVVICIVASLPELARRRELLWSIILCILFFIFSIFATNRIKEGVCLLVAIFILPCLILLKDNYTRYEYQRYITNSPFWPDATKAWFWLNSHTKSANISYVGRPVPLPLYGSGLKNNVFYTSVNSIDPVKFHYFKNARLRWSYDFEQTHKNLSEPYNYRGKADEKIWLQNLKRRKADYLFIYSLHQTKSIEFPIEDSWATRNSLNFTKVFSNDTVHIYKINL